MEIGIVGLGRMGMNMSRRWLRGGHRVFASNRTPTKVHELAKEGAISTADLKDLVSKLQTPRVVWVMLPAGAVTEEHIQELSGILEPNDILVDGGNTYYKDDVRHAEKLKRKGITFIDAGVSGGIWGLELGYCTMLGGDEKGFRHIEPLLKTLAPSEGYLYCGPTGAGHFVKMVHNGIEYGLMQAYAEGFEILDASPYKPNPQKIAHLWNQGSVVRSWLLELAETSFADDSLLANIKGVVDDSGEGRWTVQQAVETGVSAPVITLSLFQRFASRQPNALGLRILAALRHAFGGHAIVSRQDRP
jgi:6-phosphogluconate dehydrogenase